MVTQSALSLARKQLSHTDFIDLNRHAVDAYYPAHPEFKTWHGFRLCAIDGSQLRVPDEHDIVEAFGVNPGGCNLNLKQPQQKERHKGLFFAKTVSIFERLKLRPVNLRYQPHPVVSSAYRQDKIAVL